jgi:hypothetical protein
MAPGARAGPAGPGALELLGHGTPLEVLARLVPGDPLGLRARVCARLAAGALLLDVERLLLLAQVRCALRAAAWRGDPPIDVWSEERIDEAVEQLLAEERDAASAPALTRLARSLALDEQAFGAAPRRLHALAPGVREAFFALVLGAESPDRFARSRGLSLSEVARRARAGLEVLRCPEFGRPLAGSEGGRWAQTS